MRRYTRKKKKEPHGGWLSGQPLKPSWALGSSAGWKCYLVSHWVKTLERKEAFWHSDPCWPHAQGLDSLLSGEEMT